MFDRQRPQRPQMYNFKQRPSSLSQMEIRQNPSENTRFSPSRNGNLPPATTSGFTSGTPSGGGEGNPNGLPPYWLNPLYLAAILQQNNNQPNYVPSSPAAVSTSCGPNGCSAAAAAGSASSTSSSSGMFWIRYIFFSNHDLTNFRPSRDWLPVWLSRVRFLVKSHAYTFHTSFLICSTSSSSGMFRIRYILSPSWFDEFPVFQKLTSGLTFARLFSRDFSRQITYVDFSYDLLNIFFRCECVRKQTSYVIRI